MAHAQIPEEELKPLLTSLERILKPIIDVVPALTMVPSELDRIGDNLDDDILSGVPERLEKIHEKVTMDLGTKILKMQEDAADTFGARQLKIQSDLERQRQNSIKKALIKSAEFGQKIADERQEKLGNRLMAFQERGMAVEIKGQRVQFINQKDLQKKQKENIKTQKAILKEEKNVQKLIDRGAGNEEEIAQGLERLVQLQEKDRQESQTLGSKRKDARQGIGAKIMAGAEAVLPAPLLEPIQAFGEEIGGLKDNLASFGKPFMALGKFADSRLGISEKLQKLEVKKFLLAKKDLVVSKAKLLLDKLAILTNPFVLMGVAIAGLIAGLVEFAPQIKDFFMGIIDDISDFFTETIPNFFKDMFDDIYMALPSFLGGASDEEEKAIMEERAGRKSAIDQDVNPMAALNKTESSDDKLKRLKQQQQQQELDGAVSNIVNVANSTNNNTAVAVNPTVPKSTSADAMALNA
tara:strand:+ start:1620 stop:3017 length:1398 start_codon:yes stop_codon:yes gene_type:complete